ncbi:MAG TPA: tetratricopeptide repeat protein [Thermoanaerobaculia bacterium]|jgi:Flp pilus assembly protein TadD
MKRPTLLALTILLAVGAPGQEPPPLSDAGRQALELLGKGDSAGAVALLEPLHEGGSLSAFEQSLLGTLYVELGRPGDAARVLAPLADREDADAAVLYNAGRASQALGALPAAEAYFERSVALVPVSPAGRELGLLWGGRGRSFDAYRLLRPWALANPDDAEARIAAAACALRLERGAEADELIAGLPESDPKVAMLRGQSLLQRGKPEEAVALLEPFRDNVPPEMRGDLTRVLADTYVSLGRSQEAIDLAPQGAQDDVRLALILATARYRLGAVEDALKTLEPFAAALPGRHRAQQPLGPLAAQIAFEYGRLLVAAGRSDEAVLFLETSTALATSHAPAWKSLGDALLAAGRRDEALAARQRFRDLSAEENERRREMQGQRAIGDPVDRSIAQARRALADGDGERALEVLRRELLISPEDLRIYLVEVTTLLNLERHQEALERAEATLERFPGHPDALYQRGVAKLAAGDRAGAEADLRRTLEVAGGHVAAMNDLAVILMVRGEGEEARRLLGRVLELRPDDATARRNLERLDAGG